MFVAVRWVRMDRSTTMSSGAPRSTVRGWPEGWGRADLDRSEWLCPIPRGCLEELLETARILDRNPLDTLLLDPADYPLEGTRAWMGGVKRRLTDGCGFVVLDRLPAFELSKDRLRQLYWLVGSMIERPVAQAYNGTMLYDVYDYGLTQGVTVRGDLTREELNWHTDYGYNRPAPFIGLLVLRTARSGGVSSVADLRTLRRVLGERRPDLLARLFEPFIWNRAREHPEGDPPTRRLPVFEGTGDAVRARFNPFMIFNGHRMESEPLDPLGEEALNAVWDLLSEPEMHVEFALEPGQMQFLCNHRIAHRRTTYEDWDEEDRKRHLVRIFLRDEGRRSYMG
jgi:hypothetical protein